MDRKEIVNSQEYKANKAALEWWYSLTEEQRKAVDIDADPDIVDAYTEGVLYGWSHPQWIPVEERLPEPHFADTSSDWVLVCTTKGGICIDSYNHKHNEWCNNRTSVAHWMEIVPPKGGK